MAGRGSSRSQSAGTLTDDPRAAAPASTLGHARPGRIAGIDLARGLAIIGMLAVHVGPTYLDGFAGRLYALPHGRASILFVLVAGVGVSLLAASRTSTLGAARLRLAWHAVVLLLAGLALQELDHHVRVVLQAYAALFVVGIVALSLSDRWLLAVAAGVGALGPLGFLTGQVLAPATFDRGAVSISDPIGEIGHGLVLSGSYPLITWAAPFLLGMWLGRRDLRAPPVRAALVLGGGVVALLAFALSGALEAVLGKPVPPVGWAHVIIDTPHSQMPLWLAGATGSAVLVLGAALVAADALGRLAWPLVALGQLALTFYVGHLLALHGWHAALTSREVAEAALIVLAMTTTAVAAAVAWRAVLPRGPLEAVLHAPWQMAQRAGAAVQRARSD